MSDERSMGERRAGGYDLGTTDIDASICLFLDMDAYLGAFVDAAITINGGMNDSVVEKHYSFLGFFVPRTRIRFEGTVKLRVRAQSGEERCLIVRRATEPAVGQSAPRSNGITCRKLLFSALWCFEISMCAAAGTRVGLCSQYIL